MVAYRLNIDRIDIFLVGKGAHKGFERDEYLVVLVVSGDIGALGRGNADDPAGDPPDQNRFPQRVLIAKELFCRSRTEYGDFNSRSEIIGLFYL